MNEKIKVAIRVKPILKGDKPAQNYVLSPNTEDQEICYLNKETKVQKLFTYDYVADTDCAQDDFYNMILMKEKINAVLEGYNSTVFAYGPTGSGKTYTIQGDLQAMDGQCIEPNNNLGLIPKALFDLFDQIKSFSKEHPETFFRVNLNFLQIYNERIFDLLTKNPNEEHKVRWRENDEFIVENIKTINVLSAEDAINCYQSGMKNLIFATTKYNLSSSRSHSMFFIKVDAYNVGNDTKMYSAKLTMVDLAGSERIQTTGTNRKTNSNELQLQEKESININKSQFFQRKVISALSDIAKAANINNKNCVPWRESKLTCLLKNCIGGNSSCLMVGCIQVSDDYMEDNLSTLQYAFKAASITNNISKNADPNLFQVEKFKKRVVELEFEQTRANDQIVVLNNLINRCDIDEKAKDEANRIAENSSSRIQKLGPRMVSNTAIKVRNVQGSPRSIQNKYDDNKTYNENEFFSRVESMLSEIKDGVKNHMERFTNFNNNIKNNLLNRESVHSETFTITTKDNENNNGISTKINDKQSTGNSPKMDDMIHLISSIDLVKELLVSNQNLRKQLEQSQEQCNILTSLKTELMNENQTLQERLANNEGLYSKLGDRLNLTNGANGFLSNTNRSRRKTPNNNFQDNSLNKGLPKVSGQMRSSNSLNKTTNLSKNSFHPNDQQFLGNTDKLYTKPSQALNNAQFVNQSSNNESFNIGYGTKNMSSPRTKIMNSSLDNSFTKKNIVESKRLENLSEKDDRVSAFPNLNQYNPVYSNLGHTVLSQNNPNSSNNLLHRSDQKNQNCNNSLQKIPRDSMIRQKAVHNILVSDEIYMNPSGQLNQSFEVNNPKKRNFINAEKQNAVDHSFQNMRHHSNHKQTSADNSLDPDSTHVYRPKPKTYSFSKDNKKKKQKPKKPMDIMDVFIL